MGGSVVVSAVSIILVVGVVMGVVCVVHYQGRDSKEINSNVKAVDALCNGALYKDNCVKTLTPVSKNASATPHDYIIAGAKLAFEGLVKALNLTDTLQPKAESTKEPKVSKMAVDDCKDLLGMAVDRMEVALNQVGDPNVYKDSEKVGDLRLFLSDIVTYQDACMDGFGDAKAPELADVMKTDMNNATELTMSVLDIVSAFSHSLEKMGYNLNSDKVLDLLKNGGGGGGGGGGESNRRRLLSQVDADGMPNWMSAGDRALLADPAGPKPNAVVGPGGDFKTIQAAVDAYNPKEFKGPGKYVIYVKEGIYKEVVEIKKKDNILMYGDGMDKTIVSGNRAVEGPGSKYTTSQSATFQVQSEDFVCKNMGFENTAGPDGHQAVALRMNGIRMVFHNCKFEAYQDTLYPQGGSAFFRDCLIAGTIDFIFGNAATLIQKSKIVVRMPNPNQANAVTASGRTGPNMPTPLVIQDCEIVADPKLDKAKVKTHLGRPWKPYAQTIFMTTLMEDMIAPIGYEAMQDPSGKLMNIDTCFYGEFDNRGPGSNTAGRAKWPGVKVIDAKEATKFTAGVMLPGSGGYLTLLGVPHYLGLKP